jgi:hypothetical protein
LEKACLPGASIGGRNDLKNILARIIFRFKSKHPFNGKADIKDLLVAIDGHRIFSLIDPFCLSNSPAGPLPGREPGKQVQAGQEFFIQGDFFLPPV